MAVLGYKKKGKTKLVERMVEYFVSNGLRVGVVKHSHHELDILDKKYSDTYRFKSTGAHLVCRVWSGGATLYGELRSGIGLNVVLENILKFGEPCVCRRF